MVPARSHRVSRVPWYSGYCCPSGASCTWLSHSMAGLPRTFLLDLSVTYAVLTPECTHSGLGSSALARRYLRNHCCFLFLRLLRCFSSPGSPRTVMYSRHGVRGLRVRVSPFRYLRINACLRLPTAFRSLLRLSSAPIARASALRSLYT